MGYPGLNVKIGATHGGISVGEDGATHQCNEDFATMRSIPGMVIINPCDGVEATAAVEAALLHQGPVYMRFGRYALPIINGEDYKFELGKGVLMADGTDVTLVGTGFMVSVCLDARELLAKEGISARVINIHTIKPIDKDILVKAAKETGALVTAEEHTIMGGLGSAVAEVLVENHPAPMARVGVDDTFGRSGTVPALMEYYGLTAENIAAKAREVIKRK